ncbi:hypothetical protein GIY30_10910 [Gordonia sp. HNM0687]|uniref:Uncharacterized protein n=1 Tax=Gordonia mangrovi TaxID=2665643 RepID=A0A6L7GPL2_9ACTN|nr:IniB N-terminal domain-containing protein [Gordonia mangrovi]MXP21859.1 hypothetical protein [Gordonia mangrovi]UVF76230.1 IniB N-terminal domain-containing protein [Gordonia mangrovi]
MTTRTLLDFVMCLNYDPETAAAFRGDPQQALIDAGLHHVSVSDVENLLAIVGPSPPSSGLDRGAVGSDASIWSTSEVAHAFDAAFLDGAPPSADSDRNPVEAEGFAPEGRPFPAEVEAYPAGAGRFPTDDSRIPDDHNQFAVDTAGPFIEDRPESQENALALDDPGAQADLPDVDHSVDLPLDGL